MGDDVWWSPWETRVKTETYRGKHAGDFGRVIFQSLAEHDFEKFSTSRALHCHTAGVSTAPPRTAAPEIVWQWLIGPRWCIIPSPRYKKWIAKGQQWNRKKFETTSCSDVAEDGTNITKMAGNWMLHLVEMIAYRHTENSRTIFAVMCGWWTEKYCLGSRRSQGHADRDNHSELATSDIKAKGYRTGKDLKWKTLLDTKNAWMKTLDMGGFAHRRVKNQTH